MLPSSITIVTQRKEHQWMPAHYTCRARIEFRVSIAYLNSPEPPKDLPVTQTFHETSGVIHLIHGQKFERAKVPEGLVSDMISVTCSLSPAAAALQAVRQCGQFQPMRSQGFREADQSETRTDLS